MDVCITAQSGFKALLVAPRYSTCIKARNMGTASSEIPQGGCCSEALHVHTLIPTAAPIPALPLCRRCVVVQVGSSRGLEHYTTTVVPRIPGRQREAERDMIAAARI